VISWCVRLPDGDAASLLPLCAETGVVAAELQRALFDAGRGRAVGVVDLLHAATAICHRAVVLHHDADFEALADVDGRLRHRWVVPRGSVD
jgi:predicted nucleic acid-binding protein